MRDRIAVKRVRGQHGRNHARDQQRDEHGHRHAYCHGHLHSDSHTDEHRDTIEAYEKLAAKFLKEGWIVYLFHPQYLIASTDKVEGFKPMPDGLLRVVGVKLNP